MAKKRILKNKIFSFKLLLPVTVLVFFSCWIFFSNKSSVELTILHTNNIEGQLTEISPNKDNYTYKEAGFSRLLTIFENTKRLQNNVLIFDAGDTIQSNIFTRVFGVENYGKLMSELGYNAATIGEHDFDEGSDGLRKFILSANFPFLAANMDVSASKQLRSLIKPYIIIKRNHLNIAVIGLTNPESGTISKKGNEVKILDSVESCKKYVNLLRSNVNLVIVLSHLGVVADRDLATRVSGINIIIGAHTRTKLVEPLLVKNPEKQKTIIVQAKSMGKYVGELNLIISGTKVAILNYKMIHVDSSILPSPKLEPLLQNYQQKLLKETSKILGYSLINLDGINNHIRSRDTNLGILVTKAIKESFPNVQIVLQNSGALRIDRIIPKGNRITLGDVWNLHPYGNKVVLIDLTGQQIKEALERGVYSLPVLRGTFLQVDGISYTVDLTARPQTITVDNKKILSPGLRIINLKINKQNLNLNRTYRVAITDFMLSGGDGFITLKDGRNIVYTEKYLTEILEQYILKHSPLNIIADGRIKVKGGLIINSN